MEYSVEKGKIFRCPAWLLIFSILIHGGDLLAQAMGTLDPTFGFVQVDVVPGSADHANSLAVQQDGKILLGGMARVGTDPQVSLLRFLPTGELDTSFGTDGIRLHDLDGTGERCVVVLLRADGRIVAVGDLFFEDRTAFVAQYLPDGTLDTNFGENGVHTFAFSEGGDSGVNDAVLHPDGRLVIAGTLSTSDGDARMAAAVVTENGTLDVTFNGTGRRVFTATHDRWAFSTALAPDGSVLLGGSAWIGMQEKHTCLLMVLGTGELDTTFGNEGEVLLEMDSELSEANDLHVTSTGAIIFGGTRFDGSHEAPFIAKLLPNGAVDSGLSSVWSFSPAVGGSVGTEAIAVQSDGSIVGCAITSTVAPYLISLFRRTPNGGVDLTFGDQDYGWGNPDLGYDYVKGDMVLLPDGGILVAGGFTGANLNGITYLMKCLNNPELGMHDAVSSLNGSVQPMPFTDHLFISGGLDIDGYVIRDVLGRELKQGRLDLSTEDGRYSVHDIPPMLARPLILHLTNEGRFVAAGIILQE